MNPIRKLAQLGLEQFGLYYSTYRGFVVENKDPEDLNRVLLRVPIVHGTSQGITWAYPKGYISGKTYGFNCIPQIGDMVWVEFEQGRLSSPVYTPGYFLKGKKPEELKGNVIGFKSPAGNLITIEEDTATITIRTVDGTIILNDGEFNGLVKVKELTNKLNIIENKVNSLINKYNTHTHTGVVTGPSSSGTTPAVDTVIGTTKQTDIENPKVKH